MRPKPILGKVVALILIGAIIFPIWIIGYVLVGVTIKEALSYVTEAIAVSGAVSMFPTFPKGVGGRRFFWL